MRTPNGFTLIELMITVAVAAIVLTLGVPAFRDFVADNAITTETNGVVTALNVARSESTRRSTPVVVCGSSDGSNCNTDNWEEGWLVFVDTNGDGAHQSAEERLRVWSGDDGFTIRPFLDPGGGSVGAISYASDGFLSNAQTISIPVCDGRGASEARSVNLNASGRTAIGSDTDGDGTVETESGNEVSCP